MKEQEIQFDSEFEIEGFFSLTENQSNSLSGILSYSPQGRIKLKIRGISKNEFREDRYYEVIHGNFQSGIKVSLFECYMLSYSASSPVPFFNASFEVCTAFFGKHLQGKKTSDLKFKKMTLYLSHLEEWLFLPPVFDLKEETGLLNFIYDNHPQKNENEYTLTYKHPEIPSFKISIDRVETEIKLFPELNIYSEGYYDRSFKRCCSLSLSCNIEKSFDWFWKVSRKLENFLSLLTDSESRCVKFLLFTNDKENNCLTILRERAHVVYDKKFRSSRMIVSYKSIEKIFKEILETWFKKSDELQPVLDLFFLVKNNTGIAVQTEFLHLVQAVEVFHRKTDSSRYLSEEDFEKLKCKIIKKIKNDLRGVGGFRESFLNKLKYGNELSLRQRLKKIVSSLDEKLYPSDSQGKISLSNLLLENEDVKIIVDKRNELTHKGPKKRGHLEVEKLYYYNTKLSILLSYLILIETGVPKNLVSEGLIREKGHILNKINNISS